MISGIKSEAMARPIWKGHISFGLINIPVTLYPAEQRSEFHFNLIDDRNKARVKYQRVNERTGEEVPWENIVKGYEYDENEYVLLGDADFKQADVKATQTVELEDFVSGGGDQRHLFRQALLPGAVQGRDQGLRAAAGDAQEDEEDGHCPRGDQDPRVRGRALSRKAAAWSWTCCATRRSSARSRTTTCPAEDIERVQGLGPGDRNGGAVHRVAHDHAGSRQKYKDQYRERLMDWIDKKAKTGMVKVAEEQPAEEAAPTLGEDIMQLLRKSLEQTGDGRKKKQKKAA